MAPPQQKLQSAKVSQERDLEFDIAAYEVAIEQCRVAYERYFAGLERREPQDIRKRCEAMARAMPESAVRNVGLKFRLSTAKQRWTTYAQHWARIVRQIEEGTFKRDRDKAEKRFGAPSIAPAAKSVDELSGNELLEDDDDDSLSDLNELARRASAPPPPPRTSAPMMRMDSRPSTLDLATPSPPSSQPFAPPPPPSRVDPYRAVFERYVAERVRRGDAEAATLRFESVAKQLRQTEDQLRAKYNGRAVQFDVTEKDGKVVLRPVVK